MRRSFRCSIEDATAAQPLWCSGPRASAESRGSPRRPVPLPERLICSSIATRRFTGGGANLPQFRTIHGLYQHGVIAGAVPYWLLNGYFHDVAKVVVPRQDGKTGSWRGARPKHRTGNNHGRIYRARRIVERHRDFGAAKWQASMAWKMRIRSAITGSCYP